MMHFINLSLPIDAWEEAVDWEQVALSSVRDPGLLEGSLLSLAETIRAEAYRAEHQYNESDRLVRKMRMAADMIEEGLKDD